jgi:hypothetical protein
MSDTIQKPIPQKPSAACSILSPLSDYGLPSLDELVDNCFLYHTGRLCDPAKINCVKKFEAYVKLVHCQENLGFLIEVFRYECYFEKIVTQYDSPSILKKKITKTSSGQSFFPDTSYAFASTIDDLDVPTDSPNMSESEDEPSVSNPLSIDVRELTQTITKDLQLQNPDKVNSTFYNSYIEPASTTSLSTIPANQELRPTDPSNKQQSPLPNLINEPNSTGQITTPSPFELISKLPTNKSLSSPLSKQSSYQQDFDFPIDQPNLIFSGTDSSSSQYHNKLEEAITPGSYEDDYDVGEYDRQMLMSQWNLIVSKFVINGAPEQINLSQSEHDSILQEDNINKIHHPKSLLKARNEILHLIRENGYSSFVSKERSYHRSCTPSPSVSPSIPSIRGRFGRLADSPASYHERTTSYDSTQKAKSEQISPVHSSADLTFDIRNFTKHMKSRVFGSSNNLVSGQTTPSAFGHHSPVSSNSSSITLSNLLGHLKISTPLSISSSPVPEREDSPKESSSQHLKFWSKRNHS